MFIKNFKDEWLEFHNQYQESHHVSSIGVALVGYHARYYTEFAALDWLLTNRKTGLALKWLAQFFNFDRNSWCNIYYNTVAKNQFTLKDIYPPEYERLVEGFLLITCGYPDAGNQGQIIYYPSPEALILNQPESIKYGKLLKKLLPDMSDADITKYSEKFKAYTKMPEVKLFDHSLEDWERAYTDVQTCMSSRAGNQMSRNKTWRCYLTKLFNLPDNGLRLFVTLDTEGKISGRAIVHEPSKTYVKAYAPKALIAYALEQNGYTKVSSYPQGIILAADINKRKGKYLYHPYLDGSHTACILHKPAKGRAYWELLGEIRHLNTTHGVVNYD